MLKDNADKISSKDRGTLEKAVADVKEALKGSDAAAIKAASERLNQAWQSISTELYKAASEKARAGKEQAGSTASQEPGERPKADTGKDEGTVIDAEVVDEKK
jgi:molecular chaperone DnaK